MKKVMFSNAPELSEEQKFWLRLEQERYNVRYREVIPETIVVSDPVVRTVVLPCKREHLTAKSREKRDQMMFNAGRYAAGAVDRVAVDAHNALMESFDENR